MSAINELRNSEVDIKVSSAKSCCFVTPDAACRH